MKHYVLRLQIYNSFQRQNITGIFSLSLYFYICVFKFSKNLKELNFKTLVHISLELGRIPLKNTVYCVCLQQNMGFPY